MPLGPAPSAAARCNSPIASVFTLFGGVDIAFLTARQLPRCHPDECGNRPTVYQHRAMMVISQKDADDVLASGVGAVTEPGADQVAAEVAVHAVVRAPWDVAAVAVRIDLHVDMAAARLTPALAGGAQCEVAPHDDANGALRVGAQRHDHALGRPDDLQPQVLRPRPAECQARREDWQGRRERAFGTFWPPLTSDQ